MSELRAKLRAELIRWTWDTDKWTDEELDSDDFEAFERGLKAWACEFVGAHEPERDHCGIPEHDLCRWCGLSMPNSWVRPAKIEGVAGG